MARPVSFSTKNLRELQKAMKNMETAIEPSQVTPILAAALGLFHAKALELLRRLTKRTANLPEGWQHIEDAFVVREGRSSTIASAFSKVFRRASPQAIWIEWGHKMIGHKPNKTDAGKFVTANPFFRPALDITRKNMLKTVRNGIRDLLRNAAAKSGFSEDGSGVASDDSGVPNG